MKKLFLIERTDDWDYDEYDALVVCATDPESALGIKPSEHDEYWFRYPRTVKYLGIAHKSIELNSVILGSFNAG